MGSYRRGLERQEGRDGLDGKDRPASPAHPAYPASVQPAAPSVGIPPGIAAPTPTVIVGGFMKRRTVREILAAAVLALVVGVPAFVTTLHAQQPAQGKQGFPDLVGLLKATPGVIGVDAARTMSGKQVIFAWFENKKAVLNWYYSDA